MTDHWSAPTAASASRVVSASTTMCMIISAADELADGGHATSTADRSAPAQSVAALAPAGRARAAAFALAAASSSHRAIGDRKCHVAAS
eukprot:4073240-Prymnesium_polylepis.2